MTKFDHRRIPPEKLEELARLIRRYNEMTETLKRLRRDGDGAARPVATD